jgi:hypothetical protein
MGREEVLPLVQRLLAKGQLFRGNCWPLTGLAGGDGPLPSPSRDALI